MVSALVGVVSGGGAWIVMGDKIRVLEKLGDMPLWDAAGERSRGVKAELEAVVPVADPTEAGARRIGLFVDAENVRLGLLGDVIGGLMKEGEVRVRRAYGQWPGVLSGVNAEVQMMFGIELRQFPVLTNFGKNAADIAMVVDAMDVLIRDEVDVFALVSSDSDFTPLVHYLRRAGKDVWGYGLASAPDSLRMACGRFEEVGESTAVRATGGDGAVGWAEPDRAEKNSQKKKARKPAPEMVLKRVVREAAEKHVGGWKSVSEIGNSLNRAGVAVKSLGKAKLSAVLKDRSEYELKEFVGAGGRCVRVKSDGEPGIAVVFTEGELEILREVIKASAGEDGWVALDGLSEALRADERWEFEKHKGKLGKRLRSMEWVEPHGEDSRLVRMRGM